MCCAAVACERALCCVGGLPGPGAVAGEAEGCCGEQEAGRQPDCSTEG